MDGLEGRIKKEYSDLGIMSVLDNVSDDTIYIFFEDTLSRSAFILRSAEQDSSHLFSKIDLHGQFIIKAKRHSVLEMLKERMILKNYIQGRLSEDESTTD